MEGLPEDLLADILLRLPVTALSRLKSTCKRWNSLISSPYFVDTHARGQGSEKKILFWGNVKLAIDCDSLCNAKPYVIGLPEVDRNYDRCTVVGSCNGLVCLHDSWLGNLLLWNPVTRESRKLPGTAFKGWLDSFWCFGFGYDASSDDYKIVILSKCSSFDMALVYSLKGNSCKIILMPDQMRDMLCRRGTHGIYLNGSLHWPAINADKSLMSFDLKQEIFPWTLLLPHAVAGGVPAAEFLRVGGVGVVGDCLCVCMPVHDHPYDPGRYEAWVMKEYGASSSWTILFRRTVTTTQLTPLLRTQDDQVVFCGTTNFTAYDPSKDKFSPWKRYSNDMLWCRPWVYIESLVSPHSLVQTKLPNFDFVVQGG